MGSEVIDKLNKTGNVLFKAPEWSLLRKELISSMLSAFDGRITSLEELHEIISSLEVNSYRLVQIAKINASNEKIEKLIEPFWPAIREILGGDCLRQKRINLVVHLPGDEGSIIPIHSDVKTGNSPFELGLWLPLTACTPENTMWIMPMEHWLEENRKFPHAINEKFIPIVTDGSEALFFKHFLPHGNEVNRSSQTRVSLNIRFKSLFSPENKKNLLDYYTPWKFSDFTRQALREWEED